MQRRSAALHSSNRSVAPTEEDKPVQHGARQDTVAPAEARVGPGRNNSRAEHRQGGDLRARSIACSENRSPLTRTKHRKFPFKRPQRKPVAPNSVSPVPGPKRNDRVKFHLPRLHAQVSTFSCTERSAARKSSRIRARPGQKPRGRSTLQIRPACLRPGPGRSEAQPTANREQRTALSRWIHPSAQPAHPDACANASLRSRTGNRPARSRRQQPEQAAGHRGLPGCRKDHAKCSCPPASGPDG